MADTSVQGNISGVADARSGLWGTFWADQNNGVVVFIDGQNDLSFAYTDDGGATWATTEIEAGTVMHVAAWFDRETGGDTGTTVHVVWLDSGLGQCRYQSIDASDGTSGTIRTVASSLTVSTFNNHNRVAITKTKGGNLLVAYSTQVNLGCWRSSDQFATSPTSRANVYETGTQEDWVNLYPANTTDDNDAAAIFWDRSANAITIKMYDDSANTWTESTVSTTTMTDDPTHHAFDATCRHSDGAILLAAHSNQDSTGDDLLTWEILPNSISSPTVTAKTNVFTNVAESSQVAIIVNQNNDDVYVAYLKGGTWTATTDVVFHKSDDDMGSWGTEQAYSETTDDIRIVSGTRSITSSGRIQWAFINDDLRELFVNLVNDIEIVGTTTTAIQKTLTYEVQTTPTAITKALTYEVLSTPSAITKALQYLVKSTPSAITKSLEYMVTANQAITKGLTYRVLTTPSPIQKSLEYAITSAQSVTKSLLYRVTNNVTIQKSLTYEVLTTPAAITKTLLYRVKSTPSAIQKSLAYEVTATPSAITKQLQYLVKSVQSVTKSLRYTIIATPTALTKSLLYRVTASQVVQKSLSYEVTATPSAIQKSLQYLVKSSQSISKSLAYEVTSNVAVQKSLTYRVLTTPTPITKSLEYIIAAAQRIQKTLVYRVKTTPAAITKSLAYEVETTTAITKPLVYRVLTTTTLTKSLSYEVTSFNAITKTLRYLVLSSQLITKTLEYAVETTSAITKGLVYRVKSKTTVQKSLSYEVTAPVTIQKPLKYTIIETKLIQKTLEYTIVDDTYIPQRDNYFPTSDDEYSRVDNFSADGSGYSKRRGDYTPVP